MRAQWRRPASRHAEPPVGEVISRQVLGEIPLRRGDKMAVSWVRFSDREPILSVWFHRPGHDGQWWPIRDKGIRLGARRVRGFLDMVNAAAPLEAEWRRHSSRYGRREGRPPSAASEELRRDNERAVSLSTGTVEVEAAALVPTTARDSGVVPRRSSSRNPEMMD